MWTQADIDKLRKAIASGKKRVQFGDRVTEYRTLAEMQSELIMMMGEVNQTKKPYGTSPAYCKGVE